MPCGAAKLVGENNAVDSRSGVVREDREAKPMVSERSQDESVLVGEGRFAATHWSVVLAAANADSQEEAAALEILCKPPKPWPVCLACTSHVG